MAESLYIRAVASPLSESVIYSLDTYVAESLYIRAVASPLLESVMAIHLGE